jgi:hypothetical protein
MGVVSMSVLMRVRVRGTDLWVGKKSPSYAFRDGARPSRTEPSYDPSYLDENPAFWWVTEKYAKVWTDMRALKACSTMGRNDPCSGFPDLEVVFGDGTVKPFDEICPPQEEK